MHTMIGTCPMRAPNQSPLRPAVFRANVAPRSGERPFWRDHAVWSMKVQIVVYDGFDELDGIAPYEVLKTACETSPIDLEVEFVSTDGKQEILAAHGLKMMPNKALDVSKPPDVLLVPGGGWHRGNATGARAEVEKGVLPEAIAELHELGTTIAAVCTGGMVLLAAGLLEGRHATTHHASIAELRANGAATPNARVVDDGDIVTAGGVTSGMDLALWLVEKNFGCQVALRVEQEMEYQRRGTVWRPASVSETERKDLTD